MKKLCVITILERIYVINPYLPQFGLTDDDLEQIKKELEQTNGCYRVRTLEYKHYLDQEVCELSINIEPTDAMRNLGLFSFKTPTPPEPLILKLM